MSNGWYLWSHCGESDSPSETGIFYPPRNAVVRNTVLSVSGTGILQLDARVIFYHGSGSLVCPKDVNMFDSDSVG